MANEEEPFIRENELPDDFLNDIDRELEALTTQVEPMEFQEVQFNQSFDPGIKEMQETFLSISRNSLGPMDRYMKALSVTENFQELLEICELIVTPIIPKTESVGLNDHADDLIFFRSLLVLAMGERDPVGMDAMREVVMEGFSKMSGRFGLSYRGYRLAVKNLVQFYRGLKNTDGVHESDVRKFFAIGVPSLTWIRRTKPEELANLSGIDVDLVKEIRKLAHTYRTAVSMTSARLAKDEYPPRPIPDELSVDGFQEPEEFEVESLDVVDADVMGDVEMKTTPRGQA